MVFWPFLFWDTHRLGQDLGRFRKPTVQTIKYVRNDPITYFQIFSGPSAISKVAPSHSVQLGHLTC